VANSENQVIEIIPTLLVADNTFDEASIPHCTLCVEIGDSRIRLCIVRDVEMECIWLEDYAFDAVLGVEEVFEKLKRIFAGHMLWSFGGWKHVRIAINSHAFSLIPDPVFDPEMISEYLSFALGAPIPSTDLALYHDLPLVHAQNVFSVPGIWHEWIVNHFGSSRITFYHLTSPLIIGALVSHVEHQEVRIASVYFEKDHFTLVVSESEKLVLCNRFRYNQVQEMVYIILFTLSQLSYLPEQVQVICYGEINASNDQYKELAKFFPNLQTGNRPSTLKYSRQCAEVPGHRYFGLFNTYLVSS
jgi:hypothetical protein